MSKIEIANTGNAVAVYNQPEALKEKINEWIKKTGTYDDHAQSSFVQSINLCGINTINDIISHVDSLKGETLRAITTKRNRDVASLKLTPSLIAKSLGCGTVGGLAAAHIATQITTAMVVASCATPAGWIGGTGTAVVYYQFDKQDQINKIKAKALLDVEKTNGVIKTMLLSLSKHRSYLQLNSSNEENSRLNRINEYLNDKNNTLNAQLTGIGRDFNAARNQIDQLDSDLVHERTQIATAQTRISSLDSNVAALQQENQNLRTDLSTNQTYLTATATRIDELQRQNALNLASVHQMNRDLIAEMRSEFQDRERANAIKQEDRERTAAAKQIAQRGIEKALRQEQEKKISQLIFDLTRKSAAFEILQSEHDQLADQIGYKFDVMTQAMSRNPTKSSVSELLRSNNQQDVLGSESENNDDFIEIEQEM